MLRSGITNLSLTLVCIRTDFHHCKQLCDESKYIKKEQRERETDRQTDTQTHRQREREREIKINKGRLRDIYLQVCVRLLRQECTAPKCCFAGEKRDRDEIADSSRQEYKGQQGSDKGHWALLVNKAGCWHL